jgi:hypothetical protein
MAGLEDGRTGGASGTRLVCPALNVMFEMLCHCLTDAAIDLAWNDVSAGVGQASASRGRLWEVRHCLTVAWTPNLPTARREATVKQWHFKWLTLID